jgi:hypothetical protein
VRQHAHASTTNWSSLQRTCAALPSSSGSSAASPVRYTPAIDSSSACMQVV